MLRRLSLALAVAAASNGLAWAEELPLSTKTDLITVYQEAASNNADLAAARADYQARREVVPQARAGLLPNLSAGAGLNDTRTELDEPSASSSRSGMLYQAMKIIDCLVLCAGKYFIQLIFRERPDPGCHLLH